MRRYPLNKAERIRDLKELTDRSVRTYKNHDAFKIMQTKTKYTRVAYSRFGDDLCALANAFIGLKYAGQRIALIGENSYNWILSYFAIVNINATIVPLDKELSADEMLSFVQRSGARVIIHSQTFEEEVRYISQNIEDIYTISLGEKSSCDTTIEELRSNGRALVSQGIDHYSNIEIDRTRACSILFTSGTTGTSKGVMLSHSNIAANTVSACELVKFTEDDVLLSVLPINHAYEDVCGIFGPMYYGAAIAFCDSVKSLPACLKLFRPTVMAMVPLYVETFQKRIWESAKKQGKDKKLKIGIALANLLSAFGINVRDKLLHDVRAFFGGRLGTVICGGAYLNPELIKGFRDFGITIIQGYGITECAPIISANRNKLIKEKSVGLVASCNEVRFDGAGQILVKGDNVMLGYLDDAKATKDTFDGQWFKTGDLGFIDEDGFLYVTGRCKNLIVLKNGKNVMPEQIESLLLGSPLITEVMVTEAQVGANGAESLMAIIYPDQNNTQGMSKEQLRRAIQTEVDRVNSRLLYYKKVHEFRLRDTEFPKTTTKKIKRYQVK